jgi:transcriptional regulator with XRE-family HTH domain
MLTPVATVAANLARLRATAGLSTAELARRSGVARATLTALEAGQGNPTLETLYALANALGVPLSDLIAEPASGGVEVRRAGEGPQARDPVLDGELMARFEAPGVIGELYRLRIRSSGRRVSGAHPPGVREYLLVDAGVLRTGPETETVELAAGDLASFDASVGHVYEAVGGEVRATLLVLTRR